MQNKIKNTQENKKQDGKFKKKHIDHSPLDESSRAKFGSPSEKNLD